MKEGRKREVVGLDHRTNICMGARLRKRARLLCAIKRCSLGALVRDLLDEEYDRLMAEPSNTGVPLLRWAEDQDIAK